MYRYVLFDLDGTLTDPKVGICTSVQYALEKYGIIEEDLDKLEPFIGPPLDESFKEFYGFSDEDAKKAISYYRERYSDIGKFENEVYPGIAELLRDLKKKGRVVALATSKPQLFAEQILEHYEIKEYFDYIVGSEMDGTRGKKIEVIEEAVRQIFPDGEPDYDEMVMIGDRKFDIESSLQVGMRNIGVGYGYGSREELEEAGADKIVNTVSGLRAALLPMVGEDSRAYQMRTQNMASNTEDGQAKGPQDYKSMMKEANKKSFANMWGMIGPVITYKVGAYAGFIALWTFTIMILGQEIVEPLMDKIIPIYTALGAALLSAFLVKSYVRLEKKEKEKEKPKLLFKAEPAIFFISILLLALGLNGLALIAAKQPVPENLTQQVAAVADTTAVDAANATMDIGPSTHEMIGTLPIWLILLLYGVLMPVIEQFIYTGFAYRRAIRFMNPSFAYAVIVFLFAFTKNYTIEGVAGFAVYAAVLYAFTRYPHIWYAMILHAVASILVHLQDYVEGFGNIFLVRGLDSALAALGMLGICIMIFLANKAAKESKISA